MIRLGNPADNPYYAGLNMCILGSGLVYVWNIRKIMFVCVLVILMWLIPAHVYGFTPSGVSFSNLYFIVVTSIIAVAANKMRFDLAKSEWAAKTELSKTSAELRASFERVQELDRLKNQFFANISHELRTPLALITAPLEDMLSSQDLPQRHRKTLRSVARNGLRLHRLIDGLLDLARLEAGRLQLRLSDLDLPGLLRNIVGAFQPAAESLRIQLSLTFSENSPSSSMLGDSEKLEVVFTNLIGNAMKFTNRGGRISVIVRYEAQAVEIDIQDTGPGIALADQKVIFERFHRIESEERKQGGAGIGLALVKELIELHGGTVSVKSEKGKGSTFTVRLWLGNLHLQNSGQTPQSFIASHDGPERAAGSLYALSQIDGELESSSFSLTSSSPTNPKFVSTKYRTFAHIIVAEDNPDLRVFLKKLLSPQYRVLMAPDGLQAAKLARESSPDLVLADVMMPHMSGIELCQRLKNDPKTAALPVILLTARSSLDDTIEGFSQGADDYLSKPFRPRELLMRIEAQLKIRRLTAQVISSARLASVGTLAAGVAHEIRNPLNAIVSGLRVLKGLCGTDDPRCSEVFELVEDCTGRIASILGALTEHARPSDGEELSLFDFREGVQTALRLLADRLTIAGITVETGFFTDQAVEARPRQLNQVLVNLLDNAIRASPKGGRVFVTLDKTDRDTVCLQVRDEGPGIAVEHQDRIFDPFFTTREPGEGTGLGLYLSRQIVCAHHGFLTFSSAQGATFVIELPFSQNAETAAPEHEMQGAA